MRVAFREGRTKGKENMGELTSAVQLGEPPLYPLPFVRSSFNSVVGLEEVDTMGSVRR